MFHKILQCIIKLFLFLYLEGGVGIKNSIDVLAPMFEEENSSDAPRLVSSVQFSCFSVVAKAVNMEVLPAVSPSFGENGYFLREYRITRHFCDRNN